MLQLLKDHPRHAGVRHHEIHMRQKHRAQRRQRLRLRIGRGLQPAQQLLVGQVDHRDPDRFLAVEMTKHRALRDTHRLRQVGGRHGGRAALGGQRQRGGHQGGLAGFGGLFVRHVSNVID